MKLQVVAARTGATWVKEGIRTFWRQPLALSGLFFVFLGLISITSLLPYFGAFAGLIVLPAMSLGLMAASREALLGKFPMPSILFIGFPTRCYFIVFIIKIYVRIESNKYHRSMTNIT